MELENIKNKIKDSKPYINGWERMKRSSIIIPLIELDGEIQILFQVRSKNLKSQPGDICFPGGKIDGNETPKEAALREMFEELGVKSIEIINELDIVVRYDGIIIHPHLGIIKYKDEININKSEVDHIFFVPLAYLLKQKPFEINNKIKVERAADFPYDLIVDKKNYKFREASYRALFYKYESYNIWGITAEILHSFLGKL